ncbi:MAG: hypothetical protein AB1938_20375 [Myxococcota bacterium]
MFSLRTAPALALLGVALCGCFVQVDVKEVCQRSPAIVVEAAGDAREAPFTFSRKVAFAVPVDLGDKVTLDVTLERVVLAEVGGPGTVDFLSRVDVAVTPAERAIAEPLALSLAPRGDGAFGFEGAVDVTPLLSGATFHYAVDAEGRLPAAARTVEVEACATATVWLSLP